MDQVVGEAATYYTQTGNEGWEHLVEAPVQEVFRTWLLNVKVVGACCGGNLRTC